MSRHKLTQADQRKGGQTVARLPGGFCPRCGLHFPSHARLAGHLGLHAYADKYCDGDLDRARLHFSIVGAAASDPFPENGAYAEGHKFLAEHRKDKP